MMLAGLRHALVVLWLLAEVSMTPGLVEACWAAVARGLVVAQQPTDLGPV